MDPGSKVTYNGVEIGRVVGDRRRSTSGGEPKAKVTLDVNRKFVNLIPANVDAEIKASTVFGNKYIAFSSPPKPDAARLNPANAIDVSSVTTEFNTLFETVVSVAQQVDPIKLNETLTATAQALDGLGDRFGESIQNGNAILADVNPQMPRIRQDNQRLADLADVYADAAPDLFDGLKNAVTTARTLNDEQAQHRPGPDGLGRIRQHRLATSSSEAARTWSAAPPTWCPPARCSTSTARRCSAPSATTTTSSRRSPRRWAATATRCAPTPRCSVRPTRTCTPTTCRA